MNNANIMVFENKNLRNLNTYKLNSKVKYLVKVYNIIKSKNHKG